LLNLEFNLRDVSYRPTLFPASRLSQKSDPIHSIRPGMGHPRGCIELIMGKHRTNEVFGVLRFWGFEVFGVSRDRGMRTG